MPPKSTYSHIAIIRELCDKYEKQGKKLEALYKSYGHLHGPTDEKILTILKGDMHIGNLVKEKKSDCEYNIEGEKI